MAVYLAQGCKGVLSRDMRRTLGFISKFYAETYGQPVFMQATENGTSHMDASLHYDGDAVDILFPTEILSWKDFWAGGIAPAEQRSGMGMKLQLYLDKKVSPNKAQVIAYSTYLHIEWDPQ